VGYGWGSREILLVSDNAKKIRLSHNEKYYRWEPIQNTYLAIGFFFYVGINTKLLERGIFQVKSSKRGYSEVFPKIILFAKIGG
jgi:hypothetical protein